MVKQIMKVVQNKHFLNRAGGGDQPPASHGTVHTVRYTALSIFDVH